VGGLVGLGPLPLSPLARRRGEDMELLGQALISGLLNGLVYSLIALGLSLIWGVMDIVNFAHAEYLMLAMFLTYWLWALAGLDPLMSLPIVVPLLFLLGVGTYRAVIRRIVEAPMVSQIFTTFGLFLFLRYGAFALWGTEFRKVEDPLLEGSLRLGPFHVSVPKLAAALAALLVFLALHLFLTRTKTGKALQATAQDREVALSLGIDVQRMYALGPCPSWCGSGTGEARGRRAGRPGPPPASGRCWGRSSVASRSGCWRGSSGRWSRRRSSWPSSSSCSSWCCWCGLGGSWGRRDRDREWQRRRGGGVCAP